MQKLEERFPNRLPKKEISSYELGSLVGQQDVIDYLKTLLKLYEEEDGELEDK